MSQSSWWADSGPDSCEFCEVSYYGETGYHCAMCDRPMCSSCTVTVFDGRRVLCPECEAECASGAEQSDLQSTRQASNERKDENNGEQS